MTSNVSRCSLVRHLGVAAVSCGGAAALVIACSVAAVRLTGTADDVRRNLRLSFAGVERTPEEALRIALQNGRIAAATLLCAIAVRRLPSLGRGVVDIVLAAVLATNAALVGLALGAYGERLLVATAAHAPTEFGALSLAAGAYAAARRRALPPRALACVGGISAGLLVIAAVAETYVFGGPS